MKTKKIIYILLIALLCLPAIQSFVKIFPEKPLKGSYSVPDKPVLKVKSWFDDSFQEAFNVYLDQTVAFRPFLVRINNQIAYSIFDTALANSVIVGKKNYLFEKNYIDDCQGWNFVGEEKIKSEVAKAKWLQDKLAEDSVHFVVIFAPGKGTFYEEFIPDIYRNPKKDFPTNYKAYKKHFTETGVNFVDFSSWFKSMKDTSKYPLITKSGIHWSLYGVTLAVDSLVNYMEQKSGIDMVDFGWDKITVTRKPRDTDDDIAQGMNLLFRIPQGNLAYPHHTFNDVGKTLPEVIVVGDSYYWNILGSGISRRLFRDKFWYYNQEVHSPEWDGARKISEINRAQEAKKQDFVIVLFTEANLYKFPFKLFDDLIDSFRNPEKPVSISAADKEQQVAKIMKDILGSPGWKADIERKAKEKKIPFDSMLKIDATWVFENKATKAK